MPTTYTELLQSKSQSFPPTISTPHRKSPSPDAAKAGYQLLLQMREQLTALCLSASAKLPSVDHDEVDELARQICRGLVNCRDLASDCGKEIYEGFPEMNADGLDFGEGPTWYQGEEEVEEEEEDEEDEDEPDEEELALQAEAEKAFAELEAMIDED